MYPNSPSQFQVGLPGTCHKCHPEGPRAQKHISDLQSDALRAMKVVPVSSSRPYLGDVGVKMASRKDLKRAPEGPC